MNGWDRFNENDDEKRYYHSIRLPPNGEYRAYDNY